MRPKRDVLLLLRNDLELSRWRFILETRLHLRVHGFTEVAEALDFLHGNAHFCHIAVTNVPGALGDIALVGALERVNGKVLLFGVSATTETYAHRFEPEGDSLAERVLAATKMTLARKRGPKPLPKITEPQRLRQLVIERDGVPAEAAA